MNTVRVVTKTSSCRKCSASERVRTIVTEDRDSFWKEYTHCRILKEEVTEKGIDNRCPFKGETMSSLYNTMEDAILKAEETQAKKAICKHLFSIGVSLLPDKQERLIQAILEDERAYKVNVSVKINEEVIDSIIFEQNQKEIELIQKKIER